MRQIFDVTFRRDDGTIEWWGMLFTELDEARRWAIYELARRRRRKGCWHAEIVEGHWDGAKPEWFARPLELLSPSGRRVSTPDSRQEES